MSELGAIQKSLDTLTGSMGAIHTAVTTQTEKVIALTKTVTEMKEDNKDDHKALFSKTSVLEKSNAKKISWRDLATFTFVVVAIAGFIWTVVTKAGVA